MDNITPKDNKNRVMFFCPNRMDSECVYYSEGPNKFCKYSVHQGTVINECICNSSVANTNRMVLELKKNGITISDRDLEEHNKTLRRYLYKIESLTFIERFKFLFGKLD